MPEHIQYEDDELFNPDTHHESSDVPIRPLFWFIIGFIIFGVVTHLVLGFLYKGFVKAERSRMDPPASAVQRPANADVPQNLPLLQPFPRKDVTPQADTPVTDLIHMREREQQQLTSYGWVDKQHGVVHIPIQLAKETLAARIAVQGQTSAAAGVSLPAETGGLKPAAPLPATNTGAQQ